MPSDPDPRFEDPALRVVGRLAVGGMGELFVVEHRELGRTFVAKVLKAALAEDPFVVERFRLEARALGRLGHPHIVSVVNVGTTRDGRPYLLLEHLVGRSLSAEVAARGPLPVSEALAFADQMLSALEAAHGIGVVHRDIKPSNLFVVEDGRGARWLKVLDFGIAKVLPEAPPAAPPPLPLPTVTGAIVGTPRYVSPEGARGERVDGRADLYSAALVLYVMLAGRGPFDHLTGRNALFSAHAHAAPEPPRRAGASPLPAPVVDAVTKGLAKRPEDRFQSAAEFREALSCAADRAKAPSFLQTTAIQALPSSVTLRPDEAPPLPADAFPTKTTALAPSWITATPRADPEPTGRLGSTRLKPVPVTPLLLFVFVLEATVAATTAAGLVAILRRLWL